MSNEEGVAMPLAKESPSPCADSFFQELDAGFDTFIKGNIHNNYLMALKV